MTTMTDTTPSLTPRQHEVYLWIRDSIEDADNLYSPSLEEIGARFNIGISASWQIVQALIKKGLLVRSGDMHRGLRLPAKGVCHACHRAL